MLLTSPHFLCLLVHPLPHTISFLCPTSHICSLEHENELVRPPLLKVSLSPGLILILQGTGESTYRPAEFIMTKRKILSIVGFSLLTMNTKKVVPPTPANLLGNNVNKNYR